MTFLFSLFSFLSLLHCSFTNTHQFTFSKNKGEGLMFVKFNHNDIVPSHPVSSHLLISSHPVPSRPVSSRLLPSCLVPYCPVPSRPVSSTHLRHNVKVGLTMMHSTKAVTFGGILNTFSENTFISSRFPILFVFYSCWISC